MHQEVEDERQRRITGEAALPGHLEAENSKEESAGSPSFVPADRADDLQLQYALDLLNGVRTYEVKANTDDQSATVAN